MATNQPGKVTILTKVSGGLKITTQEFEYIADKWKDAPRLTTYIEAAINAGFRLAKPTPSARAKKVQVGDKTLEVRQYVGFTFDGLREHAFVAGENAGSHDGLDDHEDRNLMRTISFNKDFRGLLKSNRISFVQETRGSRCLCISYDDALKLIRTVPLPWTPDE